MMKRHRLPQAGLLLLFVVLSLVVVQLATAEPETPNVPTAPPNWLAVEPLTTIDTNAPNGAYRPDIAVAPNGKIMVAYIRQQSGSSTDSDPYYRVSTNDGQTFTNQAPIVNNNGLVRTEDLDVLFDNSNVAHALWVENNGGTVTLEYAKESGWPTSAQELATGVIAEPRLVVSSTGMLFAFWVEPDAVHYAISTNGGTSWLEYTIPGSSVFPVHMDVKIDGSNQLHVSWEGGFPIPSIYYAKGAISGSTVSWTTPAQISTSITTGRALYPQVTVAGSVVHVSYTHDSQPCTEEPCTKVQFVHHMQCSSNCNNANNWSNPVETNPVSGQAVDINSNSPVDTVVSTMAQWGNCTLIYFQGVRTGENEQIIGVNSCDRWATSARDVITPTNMRAINPDMVTNGQKVYMVYEDATAVRQILFRRNNPTTPSGSPIVYLPYVTKR